MTFRIKSKFHKMVLKELHNLAPAFFSGSSPATRHKHSVLKLPSSISLNYENLQLFDHFSLTKWQLYMLQPNTVLTLTPLFPHILCFKDFCFKGLFINQPIWLLLLFKIQHVSSWNGVAMYIKFAQNGPCLHLLSWYNN